MKDQTNPLSPDESAKALSKILESSIGQVVELRNESDEAIVFVVHRPSELAQTAMKALGVPVSDKKDTVFGLSCQDAARAWGNDLITRRWCSAPPKEDEIKVFLIAGNGTALLTLSWEDGKVMIDKEPDIFVTEVSLAARVLRVCLCRSQPGG
jgi:hypothetical protein